MSSAIASSGRRFQDVYKTVRAFLGRTGLGTFYRWIRFDLIPQLKARFSSKERERLFTQHFEENHWQTSDSRSGPGSTLSDTAEVRQQLPKLIAKHQIESLLDVPCGDWAWMQTVDLGLQRYVGADIVQTLVDELRTQHGRPGIEFARLDVVRDEIPEVDAILCRDLLIHLPNSICLKVLKKFKKSGAAWLLTTTSLGLTENRDVIQGRYRPINLCLPPFNLPPPSFVINEGSGGQQESLGRCLGVWELSTLDLV